MSLLSSHNLKCHGGSATGPVCVAFLRYFRHFLVSFEVLDQEVLFFVRALCCCFSHVFFGLSRTEIVEQKTPTAARRLLAGCLIHFCLKVPLSILVSWLWPRNLCWSVGELKTEGSNVTGTSDVCGCRTWWILALDQTDSLSWRFWPLPV